MGSGIEVRPLTRGLGAEIGNVDLAGAFDDAAYAEVRRALNEHGVIFFRDQPLTGGQFLALASRFGEPYSGPGHERVPDHPLLHVVRKEDPKQNWVIGGSWHTDQSFMPEPALGTLLIARTVPESGGDTLFLNTARAYEALSEGLKKTLEGLRAVHSLPYATARYRQRGFEPHYAGGDEAVHPVVTRHPENGRKVLYVNPNYTERFDGWTREESAGLLDYLFRHAQRPEFCCRFRWTKDAIAFWDNRQTWHHAVNDYGTEERVMHRIMITGTRPVAASTGRHVAEAAT